MFPTTDVSLLSQDSQKFCAPAFPSFMPNFYKMRYNHPTNLKVIAHYTVAPQQNFTFLYFFPSNTFKPKAMWKHSHISCLLPYNTNHPPHIPGQMSPISHNCYNIPHCCLEACQNGHSNHCSNPALKAISANLQVPPNSTISIF